MMDKNREAFEAWWVENCTASSPKGSSFGKPTKAIAFDAWQASRKAIEVKLPSKLPEDGLTSLSYNLGLDHAALAISHSGIRVKGNGE